MKTSRRPSNVHLVRLEKSSPKALRGAKPGTPNFCGAERIPERWAWHHQALMHLRARLQQSHADHASQATTPPDKDSNDAADSAQDRTDRDLLWAELGAENDKLFEVDCALQRIRDGSYGFCESTGHPIPPERLRAVPWTRFCRAAAEVHEIHSSHSK